MDDSSIFEFHIKVRELTLQIVRKITKKVKELNKGNGLDQQELTNEIESIVSFLELLLKLKKLDIHREMFATDYRWIAGLVAEICYLCEVDESEIVCQAIKNAYLADADVGVFFGTSTIINMEQPDVHQENNQSIFDIDVLDYYLKHSVKGRLIFGGGLRFVDLIGICTGASSMFSTRAFKHDPGLMLLLLRHGFDVLLPSSASDYSSSFTINFALARCFSRSIANGSYNNQDPEILCAKIVLRSVKYLNMSDLTYALETMFGEEAGNTTFTKEFVLAASKILPDLKERYICAPSLKHLCRCEIRESLRMNWNLPKGFEYLQIPKSLKNFLDLLDD